MTQRTAIIGTTAILIALGAAAQAEVTGADVWANWKAAAESVGQTLTPGSEVQDGDTLTISDLMIAMDMAEVKLTGGIDRIAFRDNGDGTVAVSMSPRYTMSIDASSDDAEDAQIDLSVNQEGLAMVASGDPDAITYDFLASSMAIAVESLVVEDERIDLTATATISDMDGKYVVRQGEMTEIETDLAAGRMVIAVAANEPGGSGVFKMDVDMADLAASSAGALMLMADPAMLAEALASGMRNTSRMSHGGSTYMIDFQDSRDQFRLDGSSGGGGFDVSMDAEALAYSASNTALDIRMSGSEIPLPEVAFGIGELGMSFLMPVAKSETPGDFGASLTLRDLSVSDMIWGLIDAGGQLPHDPATLVVDLAGKANWLFDIFDPDAMAQADAEMPAELHALDVNALQLKLAGAELTGAGAFTFDMGDLATFDGMPAPTGALDLKLVGGNGLLDKLVAMGVLPEEQAMGARMMMGLFARPGDGADTLVSKIEVDGATGAVSANGQRLQ